MNFNIPLSYHHKIDGLAKFNVLTSKCSDIYQEKGVKP